jgi:small neutral amino acid transporter SnatA (MarC family)
MEGLNQQFLGAMLLLLMLLNPFLMSIYLLDLIESLDNRTFRRLLVRGATIATAVFCVFAVGGDALFTTVFQVRFAAFLIFGGVLFLVIGLRFAQVGPAALAQMRGEPEHIAGSIAMPFMVGPGTVSASVLAGARLTLPWALIAIVSAMACTVLGLFILKWLHDFVKARNAGLVSRYIDLVGRASALFIGTVAIDMVLRGIELWWADWHGL